MDQDEADRLFEDALKAGDEDALTAEILRRFREAPVEGTTFAFRIGWKHAPSWRQPVLSYSGGTPPPKPYERWAREAARALISDWKRRKE